MEVTITVPITVCLTYDDGARYDLDEAREAVQREVHRTIEYRGEHMWRLYGIRASLSNPPDLTQGGIPVE